MTLPLKVIDRDSALEARIEAEYQAMCKAHAKGHITQAKAHCSEMKRLCRMRSREAVERQERQMGLSTGV